MFTNQELNIILQLISNANIKGGDSIAVAHLIQKIDQLITGQAQEKPKETI